MLIGASCGYRSLISNQVYTTFEINTRVLQQGLWEEGIEKALFPGLFP
jgi:hypothetical protein